MRKLENTYGEIETTEVFLSIFYACQQDTGETVSSYAARITCYKQVTNLKR